MGDVVDLEVGRSPGSLLVAVVERGTTVIVIRTDPFTWTGGDAWWDVGVPEVSEKESVRVARAAHDTERKHQRVGT